MASRQSREYRTLQRNFSIVVESLAPNVDPTHFAQKLNEVNLVTKNVVDCASVMSIPPAQRIQPVVAAVHAQIKLRASLYHKFIDVVQQFNPLLAEVLGKFYGRSLLNNRYYSNHSHGIDMSGPVICIKLNDVTHA